MGHPDVCGHGNYHCGVFTQGSQDSRNGTYCQRRDAARVGLHANRRVVAMSSRAFTGFILTILLSITLLALVPQSSEDPLAAFRNESGGVSIPGGKFTPELQRLLFSNPQPYIEETVWLPETSSYPTLSWHSEMFSRPNLNVYTRSEASVETRVKPSDLLKPVVDGFRWFFSFDWLVSRASATVVFDAATESIRTATTDPYTFSHTPSGTPRAVIVTGAHGTESTNCIVSTGVLYGGVEMTFTNTAADTAGEPGRAYMYFLGYGVPTGTQTVSINIDAVGACSTTDMHFVVITYTAASDVMRTTTVVDTENQANPTETLAFGSRSSVAVMVFYSGLGVIPLTSNCSGNGTCTLVADHDFGAFVASVNRGPAAGTADQVMGYTSGTDDVAIVYAAIAEVCATGSRFWVGNTANWTSINTLPWSDSSGGGGYCSVPTTSNSVTFDASSCTAACTISAVAGLNMASFTDSGFNDASSVINLLDGAAWNNVGAQTHSTANLEFRADLTGSITISGTLTLSGGFINHGTGNKTFSLASVNVSSASSYIDFGSGAWTVSGTWTNNSTSASWDAGTSDITFTSATGGTMTFAGSNLSEAEFNQPVFNSSAATPQTFTMATRGLRWLAILLITDTSSTTTLVTSDLPLGNAADTPALQISNASTLTANASTVTISSMTMTTATATTLTVTTGAWTVSGNWNTSGVGSTYTQGTGIVTFDATATITLLAADNTFDDLTVSAGTSTLATNVVVTNELIISGGTLAKSTFTFNMTTLTMSGGDLTSTSGAVVVTGNVSISSAASAIDFGNEAWTVSGTWTNASTDAAAWEAGTGTVTFDSATGGTMTFAGANLAEAELNNVTFNSTSGVAQTFTMATRSLRIASTLTITDSASTTTLDTANLNLQAATIGCLGSGLILIGTGRFLSVVTFNIDGSLTMNAIVVSNMYINRTAGTGTIDITTWTAWASGADVDVRWTFSPSVAGDTWEFVLEDVIAATSYDLLRIAIVIDTQTSVGTVVTLSEAAGWAAGDTMQINETPVGCVGAARFWVGGTGNWNDTARWSDSSGGAGGCTVPTAANSVTIDAASCVAACTVTVDVNAAMASFTNSGFNDAASTIAVQTFNFAVSGTIALTTSNMGMTCGISAGTGITATSTLTLSSGGNIQMTTVACVGDIDGAASISDTTSYIDFGSGNWTFNSTWTNATTSASWDAGTNIVTFDSATGGTMTFAGANLAEAEFNSVTFNSTGGAAQTFTMATRGLRLLSTLSITDSAGGTILATADLAVGAAADTADLNIGNLGTLTANASTVTLGTVTMTGGTSGTITVTSGAWTVSGSWNTSGLGSAYTQGTGIVTFDATAAITLLSTDNTFDDLTISAGASTMASAVVVTNTLTVTGTLATSDLALTTGPISISNAGVLTA